MIDNVDMYEDARVTPESVTELLNIADNRTVPGPDSVNYKILKIINEAFLGFLSELFLKLL